MKLCLLNLLCNFFKQESSTILATFSPLKIFIDMVLPISCINVSLYVVVAHHVQCLYCSIITGHTMWF